MDHGHFVRAVDSSAMNARLLFAIFLGLVFCNLSVAADPEPATAATVDYLIQHVAESKLIFIRNGSEHDAGEAAKLMQRKYNYVKSSVKTTEDFIRLAGTESHLSGKPYLVKMPDGKTIPSAQWLGSALREYRAKSK